MKIQHLLSAIQTSRHVHGKGLDCAVQINEIEVYLIDKLSIVYRVNEKGERKAHCLMITPQLFREPTGKPCAHIDFNAPHSDAPWKYKTLYCPDCGAKLRDSEKITPQIIEGEARHEKND